MQTLSPSQSKQRVATVRLPALPQLCPRRTSPTNADRRHRMQDLQGKEVEM